MIGAAFQFCFMALAVHVIDSNEMHHQLQPKKAVLAIYIAAKDILPALHY